MKDEFLSDDKNIVRRRMLNKVPMIDLITDEDCEFEKTFDISIKTHGIINKKYLSKKQLEYLEKNPITISKWDYKMD